MAKEDPKKPEVKRTKTAFCLTTEHLKKRLEKVVVKQEESNEASATEKVESQGRGEQRTKKESK